MRNMVIVAHPDDETIWMGGLIIRHPDWEWYIFSLSRAADTDRQPRFLKAAKELNADAAISDLDDSPVLASLSPDLHEIKNRIRNNRFGDTFDYIFTHGPIGEYTRHPRHEQVHSAVTELVEADELSGTLMFFAYNDSNGMHLPQPADDAHIRIALTNSELDKKKAIIQYIYGFSENSFELDSAGPIESFCIGRTTHGMEYIESTLSS